MALAEHDSGAARRSLGELQDQATESVPDNESLVSQFIELCDGGGLPLSGLAVTVLYSHETIGPFLREQKPLVADERGRIALRAPQPTTNSRIGGQVKEALWVDLHIDAIARAELSVRLDRRSASFVDGVGLDRGRSKLRAGANAHGVSP